jgi:hypothetical protein
MARDLSLYDTTFTCTVDGVDYELVDKPFGVPDCQGCVGDPDVCGDDIMCARLASTCLRYRGETIWKEKR